MPFVRKVMKTKTIMTMPRKTFVTEMITNKYKFILPKNSLLLNVRRNPRAENVMDKINVIAMNFLTRVSVEANGFLSMKKRSMIIDVLKKRDM